MKNIGVQILLAQSFVEYVIVYCILTTLFTIKFFMTCSVAASVAVNHWTGSGFGANFDFTKNV